MLRTLWGDPARYKEQYWEEIDGVYFTGDGAHRDKNGYYWIMGRLDDVINVSGHRLGTMEVESALVSHPKVAEAAVVGVPHEIKGQGIAAFVTLRGGNKDSYAFEEEAAGVGDEGDRRHRPAGLPPLQRRAPQDAERKDHAPPPAGHRLGRPHPGGHHHPRGRLRAPEPAGVRGIAEGRAEGRCRKMSRVRLIGPEEAGGGVARLYGAAAEMLGRVPNSYRALAHLPHVAGVLLPFNAAMQREGPGRPALGQDQGDGGHQDEAR